MDKIIIRDLLVHSIIGIDPGERINKQDILINMVLFADIRGAAENDDISAAINYRSVSDRVFQHVEESSDLLVEKLANDIARIILTEFSVERARVRVEKPGAVRFAKSVGVEIERTLQDFEG